MSALGKMNDDLNIEIQRISALILMLRIITCSTVDKVTLAFQDAKIGISACIIQLLEDSTHPTLDLRSYWCWPWLMCWHFAAWECLEVQWQPEFPLGQRGEAFKRSVTQSVAEIDMTPFSCFRMAWTMQICHKQGWSPKHSAILFLNWLNSTVYKVWKACILYTFWVCVVVIFWILTTIFSWNGSDSPVAMLFTLVKCQPSWRGSKK